MVKKDIKSSNLIIRISETDKKRLKNYSDKIHKSMSQILRDYIRTL